MDDLHAPLNVGATASPDGVLGPTSRDASRESSRSIYDSVEAFLHHHRHAVQHRHAVTNAYAPALVPEAQVPEFLMPVPEVQAHTPALTAPSRSYRVPFAPQTAVELEDACAELNEKAVREASEADEDAPVKALRSLSAALRLNARARALFDADEGIVGQSRSSDGGASRARDTLDVPRDTSLEALDGRSPSLARLLAEKATGAFEVDSAAALRRRRFAVDAALHCNTASILLDPRLRTSRAHRAAFKDAPKHALIHSKMACDADLVAGAAGEAAAAAIELVARAYEASGNFDEALLHRRRAETVREQSSGANDDASRSNAGGVARANEREAPSPSAQRKRSTRKRPREREDGFFVDPDATLSLAFESEPL